MESILRTLGRAAGVAPPLAAAGCLLWAQGAAAATNSWTVNSSGYWTNDANWAGPPFPNGVGDVAWFTNNISGNRRITNDVNITLGALNIGDDNGFVFDEGPGASLIFEDADDIAEINVLNAYASGTTRRHIINAPLLLRDDLVISNAVTGTNAMFALADVISEDVPGRSVTLTGPGWVRFTGVNAYSGGTVLQGGGLEINAGNVLGSGSLSVSNGMLAASGSKVVTNSVSIGGTLTVTGSGNLESRGPISGPGNLVNDGTGTNALTGANTYAGQTIVSNGLLIVNRSHVGGGQYTVASGATLGGTGLIASAIDVLAGGIVAPGNSIGALTTSNTFDLDGILQIELTNAAGAAGLSDFLDVNGLFDLTNGTIQFVFAGTLTNDHYIFAEYDSLSGAAFLTPLNVPVGYAIDYNFNSASQIALVIPEPSAAMMLAAAGICAAARARRRKNDSDASL